MNKLNKGYLEDFFEYYPDRLVELSTGYQLAGWQKIYLRMFYRCLHGKKLLFSDEVKK